MRGLIAILLPLALAAVTTPAAASPRRPPLIRVPVAPTTDGLGTSAWADSGGAVVRVLRDDQELGGETVLPAPDGCRLGGVHRTTLGYLCPTGVRDREVLRLQDAVTGAVTDPPGAAVVGDETQGNRANGESFRLDSIGAALVDLVADGENVYRVGIFIPIGGGPPLWPRPDARHVLTLDTLGGTRALCRPLSAHGETAYRPPRLVSIRRGHAWLRHCGSRRSLDLGPATDSLVLTRRYAAWRTFTGFTIYAFATRRTWRYALSIDEYAVFHVLSATDRRLWVAARPGQTFVVEP